MPPRVAALPLLVLAAATGCLPGGAHAQLPPNLNVNVEDLLGDGEHLFDQYKKDHVCPTYSCPSGYVPLARWPLKLESTGCAALRNNSPEAGETDYKHLEECCHGRNACYQLCGSDKQACDRTFNTCMEESCEELPDINEDNLEYMMELDIEQEQKDCKEKKAILDLLVNMGGCGAYDAHQTIHCECVAKGKIDEKRGKLLKSFYEEYSPDGVKKVKGLVEKAKGKRRSVFSKILLGLVNKYPEAIKRHAPNVVTKNDSGEPEMS